MPQSSVRHSHTSIEHRTAQSLREQIAVLETLLREAACSEDTTRIKSQWLQDAAIELSSIPCNWHRWLPTWIWQRKIEGALRQKGIFDTEQYAARYQDVVAEGIPPIAHYLRHGISERRDHCIEAPPGELIPVDLEAISLILASGLFDPLWYASKYGVTGSDASLVEDYLRTSITDSLRQPGPLFSGSFYALEHTETRIINPLVHYVRYGMHEGRRAFQSATADLFMAEAKDETLYTIDELLDRTKPVVVLYWKEGNFFFTDIATYVSEILRDAGFAVQLLDDHRDLDLSDMEVVVVAPHEYCVHGPGTTFSTEVAARVVHVNLEQWQTSWFSLSLDKMLTSRKALDINPLSARGLSRLGIKTGFLPLLPRKQGVFDFGRALPSEQLAGLRAIEPLTYPHHSADRPYDILFVGYLNKRRARALAGLGHILSDYTCFLHAPRFTGPITPDSPNMIGSRDLAQIAQNAKLLLNIHQGESHYFEWHRLVISGIAQGCVPLTEPCVGIGIVKPGEHYLEATLDEMPGIILWLLGTTAGRQEIQRIHENGRRLMADLSEQMVEHLA